MVVTLLSRSCSTGPKRRVRWNVLPFCRRDLSFLLQSGKTLSESENGKGPPRSFFRFYPARVYTVLELGETFRTGSCRNLKSLRREIPSG